MTLEFSSNNDSSSNSNKGGSALAWLLEQLQRWRYPFSSTELAMVVLTGFLCLILVTFRASTQVDKRLTHLYRLPMHLILRRLFGKQRDFIRGTLAGFSYMSGVTDSQLKAQTFTPPPVYLFWELGSWTMVVTDPILARDVFNKPQLLDKWIPMDDIQSFNGTIPSKFFTNNVIISKSAAKNTVDSNGQRRSLPWSIHRRALNPVFHRRWKTEPFGTSTQSIIRDIEQQISSAAAATAASESATVDVQAAMHKLTIESLGKTFLGTDSPSLNTHENRAGIARISELYPSIMEHFFNIKYILLPLLDRPWNPLRRQVHEDVDEFKMTIARMLIDRLALLDEKQPAETVNGRGKDNEDILNALIDAMQQDETGLVTLDVLVRNVIGMYTAAHDTTAAALTMAIAELGRNPDIQERARKHVFDIMGDPANDEEDAGAVPTAEQQRQMTYLTMIIKETLRMWPSVPVVPARRSVPGPSGEECVLSDGTVVPCGMRLSISVVAIHRNPKYWPEPHVFNPERFASDTSDSLLSNSPETVAWMPFGGGTRACAGAQASLVQQRVVLAMLLRKFRWTTPPEMFLDDGLPRLAPGFILGPTAMSVNLTLL